jgi:hypothetical protein
MLETETNTKSANEILTKAGFQKRKNFFEMKMLWRKVTALPNVDLVYICNRLEEPCKYHVQAMKDEKRSH